MPTYQGFAHVDGGGVSLATTCVYKPGERKEFDKDVRRGTVITPPRKIKDEDVQREEGQQRTILFHQWFPRPREWNDIAELVTTEIERRGLSQR